MGLPLFVLVLGGCQKPAASPPAGTERLTPQEASAAANKVFSSQASFDPWILRSTDPNSLIPAYLSDGRQGVLVDTHGNAVKQYVAGRYQAGQLVETKTPSGGTTVSGANASFSQELNMQTGEFTTTNGAEKKVFAISGGAKRDWPGLWKTRDIGISSDPEAVQVLHACLFYLLSSTSPGAAHSIPPLGLSSPIYGGHIFWDADVWMLPALVVQYPEYARSIVDYRFATLEQAKKNAKAHGFAGAEYAWESADTGAETAPGGFSKERHITADAAFAAWQYFLWTGDKAFLAKEGWPLISATAQYWVSRVEHGADGKYHIKQVVSPDETEGLVDDDAFTNAVVRYNLLAAVQAAQLMSHPADPRWSAVASGLAQVMDPALGIPAEHVGMDTHLAAKQADTLLLVHPLGVMCDAVTMGKMLDFYTAHTIKNGPAMTGSIHAIVAAKLGRGQQSMDEFRGAYRPFMRGPWDAFSEKRTTNNVYFLTGMGGLLQSVIYGFAGLSIHGPHDAATGTKLAEEQGMALYADPHLPPGWPDLTLKGIRFRGKSIDLTITNGNKVNTHVTKS